MNDKLIPFVPPEILPDDFHLDISMEDEGRGPVTQQYYVSLNDSTPISMINMPSAGPLSTTPSVGSVFYLNIQPGGLSDRELQRLRCLKLHITSMLHKASKVAAQQIEMKIQNGDKKLKEDEAERASYQAMLVNWYLRHRGLFEPVSSVSKEVEIDTSHDFHENLFVVATNGLSPTGPLMEAFENILKRVVENVRKSSDTAKSSIQQTVVNQVYICDEYTEDFVAQIWTTSFRLTKDIIEIVRGKSKSQKPRVNVQLISNCFEVPENLMSNLMAPAERQEIRELERSLVHDQMVSVDDVKIDQKLVRSNKYAPVRLTETMRPNPVYSSPSTARYRRRELRPYDYQF